MTIHLDCSSGSARQGRSAQMLVACLLLGLHCSVATAEPGQGRPVEAEGVLEIQTEDYERQALVRHFLRTQQGRVELKSHRTGPRWPAGTRVRVRGEQTGDVLYLAGDPNAVTDPAASAPTSEPVLQGTMGEQRVGVILVNFQDDSSQPVTQAAMDDLVFGDVGNFYWENSFGQTWLTGNTWGWYTIPVSKTVCDTDRIATEADNAAAAAGVNLAQYARMVYVFPNNACGWAGAGSSGGSPTRVFINGPRPYTVIAHEMGHAFGLLHAQGLDCDTGSLGEVCTTRSYGDPADVMGSGKGHFSAYHKERLGWIGDGLDSAVQTVVSSGNYQLAPYASSGSGTKGLRVAKGVDSVSGKPTWYYIEYRLPLGFDALINETASSNLTNSLLIHAGAPDDLSSIVLLDTTPNSDTASWSYDFRDGALALGRSYSDPAAGVTISLIAQDESGATVSVTLGGGAASCGRVAPTVSISGPSQSALPGTTANYTLTVTNNDSAACGVSPFGLDLGVPSGWSGALGTSSLSIAAASSGSTGLSLTVPAGTADGAYGFSATATNGLASGYATTDTASIQISASSTSGTKGGSKTGGGGTKGGGGKSR